MSHIDASQLATYNSLLDPHLAGYFTNDRRRKQLMKAGLVTRKGEIVSETTYRLTMARKEHTKHVRELLAQAIVHKTLDMERSHQVDVRKKIEEISKIELVRRVRSERGRHGDEDVLPYLSSRPRSNTDDRSSSANGSRNQQQRAQSAPADRSKSRKRSKSELSDESLEESRPSTTCSTYSQRDSVDGRRSRKKSGKKEQQKSTYPKTRIDDRHLYSLNQAAIRDYTMSSHNMDRYRGPSPYAWNQMPVPPKGTPRTQSATNKHRRQIRPTTGKGKPVKVKENKCSLMIHRPEPAMKHQERVQTLCEVTLHYFGSNLKLDYEKFDPRDDILVEQQHCGGNTLPVFDDKVLPGYDFTFTSRRHRGYPFSLAIYINRVMDCRLSVCCEYKHKAGSRLGGKLGHFGIVSVDGKSTPCYRCQVNETNEKKEQQKKKKKEEEHSDDFESCTESEDDAEEAEEEEEDERKEKSETKQETDQESDRGSDIKIPVEKDDTERASDSYSDDDFDKGSDKAKEKKRRSSSSSSSGSSSGNSSSSSSKSSHKRSSSSSGEEGTVKSDQETKPKKMEYTHMEKSEALLPSDDEEAPARVNGDQSQKVVDRSDDKNARDQSDKESDSSREGDHDNRVDNGSKVTGKEKGKDMAQAKLEDLSDSELSDLDNFISKQKASSVDNKHDFSSESETDNKGEKAAAAASRVDKDTDESNTSERSNTDNDTARSDDKSAVQQTPPTSPPEKKESKFYPSTSSDSDADGGSPSPTQQPKRSGSSSDSSSGKGKKTKQGSSSDSSISDRDKKTKQENKSDSSSSDKGMKTKPSSTSSSDSDTRNEKARKARRIKQHRAASTPDSDTDSQPERSKQVAQQKTSDTDTDTDTDSQPDTPKQAAQEKRHHVTSSSGSDTETEQRLQKSEEKQDKKSFSSSTSDSGSETETETDKNKQAKAEDKKQDSSIVSGSESSDDTMSGGYDRDGVADKEPTEPRVQTPTRVQPGSIRPLVEGKQEIVINNLALTKMQMSEMADILEDNRQIDALYLRNCDLDDDAVNKLAEALTATPDTDLKVLNLNCNKLSPASVQHILKIVKRKRNLEMLLLHGNTLGDAGAEDLCQGLIDIHKQRQDQLTTKAEEMQAIRSTAHSVVSGVMSDVMKSDSLESLKVPDSAHSSEQSDGSIAELVGSVEKDSRPKLSIQQLDLGDCRLKRAGAEAVGKLISANIGISNLCLTGNRDINTRGWKAIAEALKTNKDIEVLSLDHNKLENKATSTLADCLKENDSVLNLDLEGNKIGNRGGKKILEMVKVNSKVKDITLTPGNSISKDILADIEKTLVLRRRGK